MAHTEKCKPIVDCYEDLANGIIIQAVADYREARFLLAHSPNDHIAQRTVISVEKFLLSRYYQRLTTLDGRYILNRLRSEDPLHPLPVKRYW